MMEGPSLDPLLRRLSECPAEFLADPRIGDTGEVFVPAVVGDLVLALGGRIDASSVARFQTNESGRRNWLRLVLVGCWLAYDPWFRERDLGRAVHLWLFSGLDPLAELVSAENFVTDPDRREELCRVFLNALDLYPGGESEQRARDRLDTVDTVARNDVVRKMKVQAERARKLREEMETQRAREAAARYTRE